MPMAPEETQDELMPGVFRSLRTLHRDSTCRMFSRPEGWARVEVPILTTMRLFCMEGISLLEMTEPQPEGFGAAVLIVLDGPGLVNDPGLGRKRPALGRTFFFCKGGLGNLVGLEAGCRPVCESWRRSPHPASPFWAR